MLYERVHSHVQDRDSISPGENPFSARGAITHTKEILTSTTNTTKAVLSSISDKRWWKKTLTSLSRPTRHMSYLQKSDDMNVNFHTQGCHPFYEDVLPHAYSNKVSTDASCLL